MKSFAGRSAAAEVTTVSFSTRRLTAGAPEGEKWVLGQDIGPMLECCTRLLSATDGFLVLNLYSMGFSALLAKSIVGQLFPVPSAEEFGELFFYDRAEKMLPLGVFYRARYGGDQQGPAQKRPENSRR